jgi:drug/metabolite transporter (DMT)-like permease
MFAMLWGGLFLGESIGAELLVGFGLVLLSLVLVLRLPLPFPAARRLRLAVHRPHGAPAPP